MPSRATRQKKRGIIEGSKREGSSPERKRLSPIEREKNGERLVPGIEPSQRRLSPIERRTGEGVLLLDIIMNPTVVVRGGLAANAGRCEVSFILQQVLRVTFARASLQLR